MTAIQSSRPKRAALAAALAVSVGWPSLAHAQDTTVRTETTGPNRALIRSGILVFGLSYVPAFIVASTNPRTDDDYLYFPVAGPWLDLANRNPCVDCSNETLNKALLVTSGIFQGIGALEIVGSFLFMETRVRTVAGGKTERVGPLKGIPLSITPSKVNGGFGIMAAGTF
jgi:hypothetical protein